VQGWRFMTQWNMFLISLRTANLTPVKIQYMPGPYTRCFRNMCQTYFWPHHVLAARRHEGAKYAYTADSILK